jgi:hypothetical protein
MKPRSRYRLKVPSWPKRRAPGRRKDGDSWRRRNWIPVIVSLIAVLLSALIWWDNHSSRLVAEDLNRPVLVFKDLTPPPVETKPQTYEVRDGPLLVNYEFTNVGHTRGEVVRYNVVPGIEHGTPCSAEFPKGFVPKDVELLPGAPNMIQTPILLNCSNTTHAWLTVEIDVDYVDTITHQQYSQRFETEFSTFEGGTSASSSESDSP